MVGHKTRKAQAPRASRRLTPLSQKHFWALVILYWAFMQIPHVRKPFLLLSTWAHELGHGLGSIGAGGQFKSLIITDQFGGVATTVNISDLGIAMTLICGLLGPAIAGALMLIIARGFGLYRTALILLATALFASALIWAGDGFTRLTLIGLAGVIALLAWKGSPQVRQICAHIFAISLCMNAVTGLGYFFTGNAHIGDHIYQSDTGQLSRLFGGSHILWGLGLSALSLFILWLALNITYRLVGSGRRAN